MKRKPISPLSGTNGQLMVTAAHRYCLGRQTYIVSSCCDWLRAWWHELEDNTRRCIVRDTVIALQDGDAGADMDIKEWKQLAEWAVVQMGTHDQAWCINAVAYREKPWPLEEPKDKQ